MGILKHDISWKWEPTTAYNVEVLRIRNNRALANQKRAKTTCLKHLSNLQVSVTFLCLLTWHLVGRLFSSELHSVDAQPRNHKFRSMDTDSDTPIASSNRPKGNVGAQGTSYKYRKQQESFLDVDDILVEPFGSQPSVYTSEEASVQGYR